MPRSQRIAAHRTTARIPAANKINTTQARTFIRYLLQPVLYRRTMYLSTLEGIHEMLDKLEYVRRARDVEETAIELGRGLVQAEGAIRELIVSADRDLSVLRRAHRHIERRVRQDWPASDQLIRAFFLLSAARAKMEKGQG